MGCGASSPDTAPAATPAAAAPAAASPAAPAAAPAADAPAAAPAADAPAAAPAADAPAADAASADAAAEGGEPWLTWGEDDTENENNRDDFKYKVYKELPAMDGGKHKSLMAKLLTAEIFDKLKDLKTSKGYTLSHAIQTGVMTPHLGVGITAGDEESWDLFKEIYYPVIKGWHNYDPETQNHVSDLNPDNLTMDDDTVKLFNKYVKSTRIRAARNISGFSLPAGSSAEDRKGVRDTLETAFGKFEGDLKGTFYDLGSLTEEQTTFLREKGFLFQKPKPTNLLTYCGAARDWPENRGIFHNESHTALAWCNEEDHCRIISMSEDGNVKGVFTRFCSISDAIKQSVEADGGKFMFSEKLGFLGTCPSNLGTGLRASVMVVLPELNKDVHLLEEICESFNLQPRGSNGEHSAAVGAKWDISNKQRIGFTEVQLVQKMIDGVSKLIALEEKLAKGETLVKGEDY